MSLPQKQGFTHGRHFLHLKFYNNFERPCQAQEIIYFLKNGDYKFQLDGNLDEYLDYTHIVSQDEETKINITQFQVTLAELMGNITQIPPYIQANMEKYNSQLELFLNENL